MSPRQRARRKGQGGGRRYRRIADRCLKMLSTVKPAMEYAAGRYQAPINWRQSNPSADDTTVLQALAHRHQMPVKYLLGDGFARFVGHRTVDEQRLAMRPAPIDATDSRRLMSSVTMPRPVIMRMSDTTPPPAPDTTTFSIGRPDMEPT